MTHSDVWLDLAGKFHALQPPPRVPIDHGLLARWTSGVWNEKGVQWRLSGGDLDVRLKFRDLAADAAERYGRDRLITDGDDRWRVGAEAGLYYWLDVLKRDIPECKVSQATVVTLGGDQMVGTRATIRRVCEASAEYCLRLARRGATVVTVKPMAKAGQPKAAEIATMARRTPKQRAGRQPGRPHGVEIDSARVREVRGDTDQKVFARMCGFSDDTLQRIEGGRHVSERTLQKLVKGFKLKGQTVRAGDLTKNPPQKAVQN